MTTLHAQLTGLLEDFNDNTLTGWEVPATHLVTYEIEEKDSIFVISYHRTESSGEWDVINYFPPETVDLSGYPFISLKVKSDVKVELALKTKYENESDDWLELQLPGDNTWHTYLLKPEAAPPLAMYRMYIYLDGGSTVSKSGTVCLDDLCFGDLVDTTIIDVSILETALTQANLLYNNTVEGDDEGQYKFGSKAALNSAIITAQTILNADDNTQKTIEEASWNLYDACVTLETQVNTNEKGTIDTLATRETRYLLDNLKRLAPDYMIFGMHDVTGYGVGWSGDDDRSDVKDVCGSYPALYSEDMNKITRNIDVDRVRYRVTSAYNRGGISTFSWHQIDPQGRGFNDDDVSFENIVKTLIPGGIYHDYYKDKLHTIAAFLKSLRGNQGENIPIIFRPYHEHTGGWFWWGSDDCTVDQYNTIWQFTVTYLRDSLNVHNLLFALSPAGQYINSKDDYYNIFPGVDYIDIFGVDDYFTDNITVSEKQEFQETLRYCVEAARDDDKVAALTETGQENLPQTDFFTDAFLNPIKSDSIAINIAYAAIWRNSYEEHHFAPYPGHPTVPDFLEFYRDPFTLFEDNLPNMYQLSSSDITAPAFVSFPEDSVTAVELEITVSITTNEKAFLRYSTVDQSFNDMPNDFEMGQGTLYHSTMLSGSQGDRFRLYIRARDYSGNASTESRTIDFTIDTLQRPVYWHDSRYTVQDWSYAPAPFVFLGEGNGTTEINPVRTSYFKKAFTVDDASIQKQLIVFINFDNGFVIYINGHEVDRYSVPSGEISYSDWAILSDVSFLTRTLTAEDCQYLVDGENWISVEIHQARLDSADHLFDLKMIAPEIKIDYGNDWYYSDTGQQPPERTVGSLDILSDDKFALPGKITLYPNYPNPFNLETIIQYYLPKGTDVNIIIYDILGRQVRTLVSSWQNSGMYRINFNAGDLATGVYFLHISADGTAKIRKILLLK